MPSRTARVTARKQFILNQLSLKRVAVPSVQSWEALVTRLARMEIRLEEQEAKMKELDRLLFSPKIVKKVVGQTGPIRLAPKPSE